MPHSASSALVTDQGTRVLLRLEGHFYELSHQSLRALLGLPEGPAGLGVRVDRGRLRFEFAGDDRVVELSDSQLRQRIAKHAAANV